MPMLAAAILFVVFFGNVVSGSFGGPVYLGDVSEMLVLFAAAIFFVAGILKKEAAEKGRPK